jgi:FkbM family methyltransferase
VARSIKQSLKALTHGLGFEVRRIRSAFPGEPYQAQARLMLELGRPPTAIMDVGANKGDTALKYRAKFPKAEIFCFEPFPDSVTALQQAVGSDKRTHVVPMAVTNESGHRTFYVNHAAATNSLLPRPESARRYYAQKAGPRGSIQVPATTLDDYVAQHPSSAPQILKFDIQGGEMLALQGAQQLLHSGRVHLIYTEIFFVPHYEAAPLFHDIWSHLAQHGYSLFDIYNLHRARNGQIRFGDALFVSPELRTSVIDRGAQEK